VPRSAKVTDKQQQIYEFIVNWIDRVGYPPSIRDIGTEFEITSPNGVTCHLKALEKKGLISRPKNKARAITVDASRPPAKSGLPFLGLVAAGPAIEAVPIEEQRVDIGELFHGPEHFVLQVSGRSMIEDHIDDGDLVIIRRQSTAENGERVVAMIGNDVTLKKFYKRRDVIVLEPCNSSMAPIILDSRDDVSIVGKLVGVVRRC
jgi:repressor LexA